MCKKYKLVTIKFFNTKLNTFFQKGYCDSTKNYKICGSDSNLFFKELR